MKNLEKYSQQVKKQRRIALGHESMRDFNHGFIKCLFVNKLITAEEKNILMKVYGYGNDDYRYAIEKGILIDQGE